MECGISGIEEGHIFDANHKCTVCNYQYIKEDDENYSNGLVFKLNEDNTSYSLVSLGTCTSDNIIIPDKYNGYYVTNIKENLFKDFYSLESVQLPQKLKTIPDGLFQNCENLKNIIIPNEVVSIGEYAFSRCISLASLYIPDSVEIIESSSFQQCNLLETVRLSQNISILTDAFSFCIKLKSIVIPENVTEIDIGAFCGMSSLKSIYIPKKINKIGYIAFGSCTSLKNVYFAEPTNWTSGTNALQTKQLQDSQVAAKLLVNKSGTTWNRFEYKFTYNNNISGNEIFLEYGSYIYGEIPSSFNDCSVVKIGDKAFLGCTIVNDIILPTSISIFGAECFKSTTFNGRLVYNGTKEQWNAIEKPMGWNIDSNLTQVYCSDGWINI